MHVSVLLCVARPVRPHDSTRFKIELICGKLYPVVTIHQRGILTSRIERETTHTYLDLPGTAVHCCLVGRVVLRYVHVGGEDGNRSCAAPTEPSPDISETGNNRNYVAREIARPTNSVMM